LIILTVVGALTLFYVFQTSAADEKRLKALAEVYRAEINQPKNQSLIAGAETLNTISDRLLLLGEATGGEEVILNEIAAITPPGLALTSLIYGRGPGSAKLLDPKSTWAMTGVSSDRQLVLDFYNQLLTKPGFANGRLYFSSLEKETEVVFRVASQIKL